jgi:hypothetical protein
MRPIGDLSYPLPIGRQEYIGTASLERRIERARRLKCFQNRRRHQNHRNSKSLVCRHYNNGGGKGL